MRICELAAIADNEEQAQSSSCHGQSALVSLGGALPESSGRKDVSREEIEAFCSSHPEALQGLGVQSAKDLYATLSRVKYMFI